MSVSKYITVIIIGLLLTAIEGFSQQEDVLTYKNANGIKLHMKVYYPPGYDSAKLYPAIIFFHGGGWVNGSIDQFKPQALYLSKLGMIAITPEYRLIGTNGATLFDCVRDACSSVRFIRSHAGILRINVNKIAVAGGSAGGHLAAATDFIHLEDNFDTSDYSCRPDLLVLFNPVINNAPGYYGYQILGDNYKQVSPYHNIRKGAPAIIFSGSEDKLVPVEMLKEYRDLMTRKGNECELIIYEGQKHGFFNYKKGANRFYSETLDQVTGFLKEHGFI